MLLALFDVSVVLTAAAVVLNARSYFSKHAPNNSLIAIPILVEGGFSFKNTPK
jgi:hypothetical protein